jgi:hypothetical protein
MQNLSNLKGSYSSRQCKSNQLKEYYMQHIRIDNRMKNLTARGTIAFESSMNTNESLPISLIIFESKFRLSLHMQWHYYLIALLCSVVLYMCVCLSDDDGLRRICCLCHHWQTALLLLLVRVWNSANLYEIRWLKWVECTRFFITPRVSMNVETFSWCGKSRSWGDLTVGVCKCVHIRQCLYVLIDFVK